MNAFNYSAADTGGVAGAQLLSVDATGLLGLCCTALSSQQALLRLICSSQAFSQAERGDSMLHRRAATAKPSLSAPAAALQRPRGRARPGGALGGPTQAAPRRQAPAAPLAIPL